MINSSLTLIKRKKRKKETLICKLNEQFNSKMVNLHSNELDFTTSINKMAIKQSSFSQVISD